MHRIEWVTDSAGVMDKTDPNPYVRVIVGPDEYKTEVKRDAAGNVSFDEIVPFQQVKRALNGPQCLLKRKSVYRALIEQSLNRALIVP